jgi:soluble lytic murein transglycosylase
MKKYKILIAVLLVAASLLALYMLHYNHIHRYDDLITRISRKYGLDPVFVRALIYEESYFNPEARSAAGAIGLMQVTPIAVREWTRVTGKQQLARAFPEAVDHLPSGEALRLKDEELLNNPEINMHIGCWYLDQLMQRYSEWEEPLPIVLASYNAGPSNATRWKERAASRPPRMDAKKFISNIDYPETRRYVRNVLDRYQKLQKNGDRTIKISWLLNLVR